MYVIKNADGTQWQKQYETFEEADDDFQKEMKKYNGMLVGQPHSIIYTPPTPVDHIGEANELVEPTEDKEEHSYCTYEMKDGNLCATQS